MSWFGGKTGAGDLFAWRQALGGEFAQAEQDGLLRFEHYHRIDDQRVEAVFLTSRSVYMRCYSSISQQHYGPLTVVALTRVVAAGPIGGSRSARWGLVVAEPDADVEMGEQPLAAFAYDGRDVSRSRARDFAEQLRRALPPGRFGVLRDETAAPGSSRPVETGLLLSGSADAPELRRRLERSWIVLDARSRGVPVPDPAA